MLREEEKEKSTKKKGPTTDRERDRQFLVRLIYIFLFPLALLQEAQVCGRVLLRTFTGNQSPGPKIDGTCFNFTYSRLDYLAHLLCKPGDSRQPSATAEGPHRPSENVHPSKLIQRQRCRCRREKDP